MSGSPERWCKKCKCRCHCYAPECPSCPTIFVILVIVVRKKMIFRHEDFVLDTDSSSKSRLFKSNKLVFMGDGYRAINIMLRNCKDQQPVREKFHAQLNMREKPKFKDNEKPKQEEHLGLKGKKS